MLKPKLFYKICLVILIGAWIAFSSLSVVAAPQGGEVKSGDVTITSNPGSAIDTLIVQKTPKGIIDWQSFSIGETEHTHFAQPDVSAITLNRVVGGDLSSILGQLTATGHVWLVNPSGVFFGPNARVDVAGLLATTANISNENFLSGNYRFLQGPGGNARIINKGYINIANNGLVFLVAPGVENAGVIEATLGKVVLGSAPANSSYIVDFYGDQLLQFVLPSDVGANIDKAIVQSGRISASGGKVLLTANTAKGVVDRAINMSGIIEANTISNKKGSIVLSGGEKGIVAITGKIKARGDEAGTVGGTVKIQGEKIGLFDNANIDVSGMFGGGDVSIGFGDNVVPPAISTYISPSASIFADAITYGPGGSIKVWSEDATRFYGLASARGGAEGGSGGFVETSSKNWLDVFGARIDLSAVDGSAGTWSLDPYDVTIVSGSPPPLENGTWTTTGDPLVWTADSSNSTLYASSIISALGSAGVTVQTTDGSITVSAALAYGGTTTRILKLIAANDIAINAAITGANLNLTLETGSGRTVNIGANINVRSLETKATTGTTATVINAPNITTSEYQRYGGNVALGTNTSLNTTGTGNVTFGNVITGSYGLNIDSGGDITFNSQVGNTTTRLTYLNVSSDGNTNINGSVYTAGTQTYGGNVVLGGTGPTKTLSSTSGPVNFSKDITGGGKSLTIGGGPGGVILKGITGVLNLILQGAGSKTLGGNINATGNLSVATGGNTAINASTITTVGNQTYNGNVVLGTDTSLNTTGTGNDITFARSIAGGNSLNIYSSGDVTFGNTVGNTTALKSLNVSSIGNTNINTTSINTTGAQTYGGNVVLGVGANDTALISTAGSITFNGDITGSANNLTVSSSVETSFKNMIGTFGLILQGIGNRILGGTVDVRSINAGIGGSTIVNVAGVNTTAGQKYNGPLILGTNVEFKDTGATSTIDFAGNVDSVAGAGYGLTASQAGVGGKVIFGGAIGATDALGYLTVNAAGGIALNGANITTRVIGLSTGNQQYIGSVILGGDSTLTTFGGGNVFFSNTIDGGHGLTIDSSGTATFSNRVGVGTKLGFLDVSSVSGTNINTDTIATTGSQTYSGNVVLGAGGASDTTFSSTSGPITFNGDVSGSTNNLIVDSGAGTTSLKKVFGTFGLILQGIGNKILGGTVDVGSLNIAAGAITNINTTSVNTTGAQTYGGNVVLGVGNTSNVTLRATNNPITFNGDISGTANNLVVDSGTGATSLKKVFGTFGLILQGIGNKILGGTISAGSLNIASGASTNINTTSINTTGAQTYGGNVVLGVGANDTVLSSTSGPITFNGEVSGSANNLVVDSGTGNVTFGNVITGSYGLNVDSGGDITFNSQVGDTATRLTYLNVSSDGNTNINGSVYTVGTQTYGGNVVLGGTGSTETLDSTNGPVNFSKDIIGSGKSLTIGGGPGGVILKGITGVLNLILQGAGSKTLGGNINATGNLSVATGGNTAINASTITTVGNQTYNGNVVLGTDTSLNTTGTGNDITFARSIAGGNSLNIYSSGDVTFGNTVGNTTALKSLNVSSIGNTNINTTSINTTGAQTYGGNVVLGVGANDTALISTAGSITFNGDVSGNANNLTVSSSVGTSFKNVIGNFGLILQGIGNRILGGTVDVRSINAGIGGSTIVNVAGVNTTAGQKYNGPLILGTNVEFKDTGATSTIDFAGNVDSVAGAGYGLTASQAGVGGKVIFGGAIGATDALGYLTVNAAGGIALNGANITTRVIGLSTGNQQYIGPVILGGDSTLTTFGGGNVFFSNTIDGGHGLTIDSSGTATFSNRVGAGIKLGFLDVSSVSGTNINTDTIATTGSQTYSGNVVLGAGGASDTTFSSTSGPITFNGDVSGSTNNLIVDSGAGTTSLKKVFGTFGLMLQGIGNKILGGTVDVGSLNIAAGAITNINTASVNTTGAQTYGGNVVLGVGNTSNVTLRATNNPITFNGDISGTANNLVVDSGTGATSLKKVLGTFGLILQGIGNKILGGTISAGSLNIASGASTNINTTSINTTGAQTYGGNVVLGVGANDVTLRATNNPITFNGDVSGSTNNLIVDSGVGTTSLKKVLGTFGLILQGIGNKILGGTISAGSLNIASGASTNINTTSVNTTGAQTYGGNVVLGVGNASNVTLRATNNPITFNGDVSGSANKLIVDSGIGTTSLKKVFGEFGLILQGIGNKILGGTISVGSLNIAVGASTNINTASINTTGAQTYGGNVVLGGASPTTFNTAGGDIDFASSLTGSGQDVKLDSGSGNTGLGPVANVGALQLQGTGISTLSGAISNIRSISTATSGETDINTSSIVTAEGQTYSNAVRLLTDTSLTTVAGDILFASTIDGAFNLGINAQGNVTFGGSVGAGVEGKLGSLYVNTANVGKIYIGNSLNPLANISIGTIGAQSYLKPVILNSNATLYGTDVTFYSTVDSGLSPHSLIVNATGYTIFKKAVGGIPAKVFDPSLTPVPTISGVPLLSLTTTGGGTTYLEGAGVTTTGGQRYDDAVKMLNNTVLTAGGDIGFGSTVQGPFNLFLDTTGNISFSGDVGSAGHPIGALYIFMANDIRSLANNMYVMSFIQRDSTSSSSSTELHYLFVGDPNSVGHGTGSASIETGKIVVDLDVGSLWLGSKIESAAMTGFIGGQRAQEALANIYLLPGYKIIHPYTYMFNELDLMKYDIINRAIDLKLLELILNSLLVDFSFGFGFTYDRGMSELDYMLLLEPMECEVTTEL